MLKKKFVIITLSSFLLINEISALLKKFREPALMEYAQNLIKRVNDLRAKSGLQLLSIDKRLTEMALSHSQEMASEFVLSHELAAGNLSLRTFKQFPDLVAGYGENIDSLRARFKKEDYAVSLINRWQSSNYANISNFMIPQYNSIGGSIVFKRVYIRKYLFITLIMAEKIAKFRELPPTETTNKNLNLDLEFYENFPREELTIFLRYPKESDISFSSEVKIVHGGLFLRPIWNDNEFSIAVPLNKGIGEYVLMFGRKTQFYNYRFSILKK